MGLLQVAGSTAASDPVSLLFGPAQVGDFHRTMLYGGIYGYPSDAKNKNGKLRLLYECAPMSMIAEQVRRRLIGKEGCTA